MNNIKKKNNSTKNNISITNNNLLKNDDNVKKNYEKKFPVSINNFNCIGPCYPPNTIFYNPITLNAAVSNVDSLCPIQSKEQFDICNINDVSPDFKKFDIFEDIIQIGSTNELFLKQLYKIYNYTDAINFFNDDIDNLPIYSQKRILNSIYYSYKNSIEDRYY